MSLTSLSTIIIDSKGVIPGVLPRSLQKLICCVESSTRVSKSFWLTRLWVGGGFCVMKKKYKNNIFVSSAYDVYDKPLFKSTQSSIYRPKATDADVYGGGDSDQQAASLLVKGTARFKADSEFEGAREVRAGMQGVS